MQRVRGGWFDKVKEKPKALVPSLSVERACPDCFDPINRIEEVLPWNIALPKINRSDRVRLTLA